MMSASDDDPIAERAAEVLRTPVALGPGLRARIDDAVRREMRPRRRGASGGLVNGRIVLSPLAAGLLAAGLVAAGVFFSWAGGGTSQRQGSATTSVHRDSIDTVRVVRFVLVAPHASRVALVGDFNGWNVGATPMHVSNNGVIWTVAIPLPAGRHVYAFVVDGAQWLPDPSAPLAPEEGFGTPNSVVVVGGASS